MQYQVDMAKFLRREPTPTDFANKALEPQKPYDPGLYAVKHYTKKTRLDASNDQQEDLEWNSCHWSYYVDEGAEHRATKTVMRMHSVRYEEELRRLRLTSMNDHEAIYSCNN